MLESWTGLAATLLPQSGRARVTAPADLATLVPSERLAMVMMAYLVAMTMSVAATMAALGQSRAGECEPGRNDQRRSERKFLHMSSTVSAFVRSMNGVRLP
nr:hypothetical protein BDOA9_0101170 [Bradyrhizobium sp. DOA9]